jgi:release factor glutamine methyltransferase
MSPSPFAGVAVADALDGAVVALTAAGVDTPRLDAEVLLAHALGVGRAALISDPRRPVEGAAIDSFRDAVRRRSVGREPVAYITGVKGFRHIDLAVDSRVLIPRPETEHVVEAALALPEGVRVVDVGTGSGAIALALKQERPDLDVAATDLSSDALAVARANALRLGLEVDFAHGDLLAGLAADAVVSNPPYVRDGDELAPEIARHEPSLALFGGADGLDVVRRMAALPVGWMALEIGAGQADETRSILQAGGFAATRADRDLAGIERVVVGWR